jgi:hypothetical protein
MSTLAKAVLLVVGLLAGCASVYEDKYDWGTGWRQAKVLKLGDATSMAGERDGACTQANPSAVDPAQEFALVTYRSVRTSWKKVRPVAAGSGINVGDTVYVDSGRCDAPLVPRRADAAGGAR